MGDLPGDMELAGDVVNRIVARVISIKLLVRLC